MFKNWFLLASVSCGVGFGSTFLISRNLQQSTLAGLGTVPAVAASLTILSRQRREEIERQVAKSRLGLDDAQKQLAKAQLQLKESSYREISEHRQELQTVQQAVSRDREKKVGLERDINSLVLKKQTGESLLVQLDAKVLDKHKQLETTNVKLAQIQAQGQLAIDSGRQSDLQLQSIREKIRQYSATRQQLQDQITDLHNRSQSLQTILVDKKVDLRGIEYQISQMEERRNQVSIAITDLDISLKQKQSLLQNIDRQQQSLQQEISDLLLQKQDRILFDRLVMNISTKQNNLFELDTEISERQACLDRIAIDLVEIEARKQSAVDSAQKSELALTNIQEKIRKDSDIKEQLKVEITDLQNKEESLQAEIATQRVYRTEVQQQISVLKEQQEQISIAVNKLNRSREEKNSSLADLNLEIWNRQQVEKDINSQINKLEQKISQLEKEENRLRTAVNDLTRSAERREIPEKWENHLIFENNPHLRVLKHIDIHGTITELEIGTAREQRNFNNSFGRYLEYLPFSISYREERYFKTDRESITLTDLKNPDDPPIPEQEEKEFQSEPDFSHPEVENPVIQNLDSDNQSQSSDALFERMIHVYPVCLFCENPPMPGQDRCKNCN